MATVQDNRQPSGVQELYDAGYESRCGGDYQTAREKFTEVLRIDPTHIPSRWQIALIKGFEGDFDGSLADLELLAKTVPGNLEIRYDYGMTLMMLGSYDEAKAEFEAILSQDPLHEKAKQQMVYFA